VDGRRKGFSETVCQSPKKLEQKHQSPKKIGLLMILSFHPLFAADKNINCAGRKPEAKDLAAIKAADAIILSQGCSQPLYKMVRENCDHVFPDYDARFAYPDKIKQIHLFRKMNATHPRTEAFLNMRAFLSRCGMQLEKLPFPYPFVFKLPWGGEGDAVFLIESFSALKRAVQMATAYETAGQAGFLLQEFIPADNRSLRVVIMGAILISYWRFLKEGKGFYASLAKGAEIDTEIDPDLQEIARESVSVFCEKTGINLAGFDLLFSATTRAGVRREPLFLEINYFFGRKGLGGAERYYALLKAEIEKWLAGLGLSLNG
jgi:ribosomal protein S6--L-glutamate ligase